MHPSNRLIFKKRARSQDSHRYSPFIVLMADGHAGDPELHTDFCVKYHRARMEGDEYLGQRPLVEFPKFCFERYWTESFDDAKALFAPLNQPNVPCNFYGEEARDCGAEVEV